MLGHRGGIQKGFFTCNTAATGSDSSSRLRLADRVAAHLVNSMHGIMLLYATCIAMNHQSQRKIAALGMGYVKAILEAPAMPSITIVTGKLQH